jgi:hypothetical protein
MDYAERVVEETKTRCLWLRTKAMYVRHPQPGEEEPSFSAPVWWCLKTGEPHGPDGASACRDACGRAGRGCYEGPPTLG